MNRSIMFIVIIVGLFPALWLSSRGGSVAQGKDQPATRPAAEATTQPSPSGQSAATQPATQPADTEDMPLHQSVKSTISAFKEKDPTIKKFFENSKGYAIFFENKDVLQKFKNCAFMFAADASGVVALSGVGANHDYSQGVAVFTLPIEGLMVETAIGGQKFTYKPK